MVRHRSQAFTDGALENQSVSEQQKWLNPVEWALAQLTERITSGQYRGGEMLPGERILAKEMNIGRGSVRSALAQIEHQGLVRRRHGRGTEVLSPSQRNSRVRIVTVHSYFGCRNEPEYIAIYMAILQRLKKRECLAEHVFLTSDAAALKTGDVHWGTLMHPDRVSELEGRYDAVIFHELPMEAVERAALRMEENHFPVVVANLEQDHPLCASRVNHFQVFLQATQSLLDFGHRRIGFVGRDPHAFFYHRAVEGYRRALADSDIAPDDQLIMYAKSTDALSGYAAAKSILCLEERPTAIVAARDVLAQGVCHAIEECGLKVGTDVSVISYDNLSWPQRRPFLTTFEEPAGEMAAAAVDMALDRLANGWKPVEQRECEAKLILRRSVGPPRGDASESVDGSRHAGPAVTRPVEVASAHESGTSS